MGIQAVQAVERYPSAAEVGAQLRILRIWDQPVFNPNKDRP